jgi:hypothetical protein
MSSSSVSVTYEYNPNTAEVIILVEKNGSGIQVIPALPALSPGDWTVKWKLEAREDSGVHNPKFDRDNGIVFKSVPASLTNLLNPHPVSDTEWQLSFTNNVESANLASYDINGTVDEGSLGEAKLFHDPSIAVLPDPPPSG